MQAMSVELQKYIDDLPVGIQHHYHDQYWTMTGMNEEFLAMLGYTAAELAGQFDNRYFQLIHPDDRPRVLEQMEEQLTSGDTRQIEYRLCCKDGSWKWVLDRGRLISDDQGNASFCCVLLDITEAKKTREELRLTLERHQIIMSQSTDILFEWDLINDTLIYSDNWEKKFGYKMIDHGLSQVIEQDIHVHPDDLEVFYQLIGQAQNGVAKSTAEFRIQDINGQYIWCRVRATDQYDVDGRAIKAVGVISDIDAEKQMIDSLKKRAERDALTGLYNRAETESLIADYLRQCAANEISSLMMVDIDNFKTVNDTQGHLFGDAFLAELSSVIRSQTRSSDVVGRIGGDEFAIFLKDIPSVAFAQAKAQTILDNISALFDDEKLPVVISCSIGIAVNRDNERDFSALYQEADTALYQAKSQGKNQLVIYDASMMSMPTKQYYSSLGANIDSDSHLSGATDDLSSYVFEILYTTDDLATAIQLILEIVGKRFDVSRAYIFENSEDDNTASNTFEWCNEGIAPEQDKLQRISYAEMDAYEDNFKQGHIFYCRDIKKLPKSQRKLLESQGIYSVLQCAILENGSFRGFVGFDECTGKRMWNKEEISCLALISKILTVFLLKRRAQERDRANSRRMAEMLDNQDAYIYAIDAETFNLLYLNKKTQELDPDAHSGVPCYQAFFGLEQPCQNCPVRHLQQQVTEPLEVYNPRYDVWTLARANSMQWGDQDAYLIFCYDITKYKKD